MDESLSRWNIRDAVKQFCFEARVEDINNCEHYFRSQQLVHLGYPNLGAASHRGEPTPCQPHTIDEMRRALDAAWENALLDLRTRIERGDLNVSGILTKPELRAVRERIPNQWAMALSINPLKSIATLHDRCYVNVLIEEQGQAVIEEQGNVPVDEQGDAPIEEQGDVPIEEQSDVPIEERGNVSIGEQSDVPVDEQGHGPIGEQGDGPIGEMSHVDPGTGIASPVPWRVTPETVGDLDDETVLALLEEHARRVIETGRQLIAPGKVSLLPIIRGKLEARAKSGDMLPKWDHEAKFLARWISEVAKFYQVPTAPTINRKLLVDYRLLKRPSTPAI